LTKVEATWNIYSPLTQRALRLSVFSAEGPESQKTYAKCVFDDIIGQQKILDGRLQFS